MNQSMQHLFSQIPRADIQRSVFDRPHTLKTTMDAGYLVPIFVDEALPGDTLSLSASFFGRFSTMAVPVMDNIYLETFFFAVPNRLLWSNWQKFCGEQENPGDSIDYVVPQVSCPSGGWSIGSLSDYLGIPTGVADLPVDAFWHRAYNLIWNEWFRDENLQNSVTFLKDDGPDPAATYTLLKRGKRHDYFTSCLPWPQKGPGVQIPLGSTAPVWGTDSDPLRMVLMNYASQGSNIATLNVPTGGGAATTVSQGAMLGVLDKTTGEAENKLSGLYTDLSSASAANINTLREAFQVQRLYETLARGGSRYTEILRACFSVVSPDARLQRPEYLGGSMTRLFIHPVAQTSSTDSTSPAANLSAFSTASDTGHIFTKSFTEHCVIIGLANIRADLVYQQGLNRMFSRRTRFDFYWPTLAHLGEQAVLNKEIFAQGNSVTDSDGNIIDDQVFGYQERWAEYRYKPSMVTGKFRSSDPNSLDYWHLAQDFASLPALNASFIEDNPPMSRVVAVQNEPNFLLDASFNYKCVRPMPVYSVPGLIDHF